LHISSTGRTQQIVPVMTTKPTVARQGRSHRVLILLAAAWMAIAMAIGGTTVDARSDQPPTRVAANRTAGH
jgi:hypothetical protein